jgi:hypothetical protein
MGNAIVPLEVLENYLKAMVPGKIVTSAFPPERFHLYLSIAQHGRVEDFFGRDEKLSPIKVLAKIESVPFMLILHGSDGMWRIFPFLYSLLECSLSESLKSDGRLGSLLCSPLSNAFFRKSQSRFENIQTE